MMNNDQKVILLDALKSGFVDVTFEKKDGTIRKMVCTTNSGMIPNSMLPKNKPVIENGDPFAEQIAEERKQRLCTVVEFQEEADGKTPQWRSFLFDSVVKFSIHNGTFLCRDLNTTKQ